MRLEHRTIVEISQLELAYLREVKGWSEPRIEQLCMKGIWYEEAEADLQGCHYEAWKAGYASGYEDGQLGF